MTNQDKAFAVYEAIVKTLDDNGARCLDDNEDKKAVARALFEALFTLCPHDIPLVSLGNCPYGCHD